MTDVSIAIQHTPDREDRRRWVAAMTEQIRMERPDIALEVVADHEREGCWPTHKRALQAAGSASHHLVLQDDLALCRDFVASVEAVIAARPDSLISLYTNSPHLHTARRRDDPWMRGFLSGQAVLWPTALLEAFLEWEPGHVDPALPWDDVRVTFWLVMTRRRAFITVPSLVQHLGSQTSTLGLDTPHQVATWYIGDDRSGTEIDWTRRLHAPVTDPYQGRKHWWRFYRHKAEASWA